MFVASWHISNRNAGAQPGIGDVPFEVQFQWSNDVSGPWTDVGSPAFPVFTTTNQWRTIAHGGTLTSFSGAVIPVGYYIVNIACTGTQKRLTALQIS